MVANQRMPDGAKFIQNRFQLPVAESMGFMQILMEYCIGAWASIASTLRLWGNSARKGEAAVRCG